MHARGIVFFGPKKRRESKQNENKILVCLYVRFTLGRTHNMTKDRLRWVKSCIKVEHKVRVRVCVRACVRVCVDLREGDGRGGALK